MLLEALEEFCTLALTLNYTQTARTLHLSQSTLSRHIKGMEDELGFKLVENIGGSLRVTRPGTEFLNTVLPMVEQFRDTVDKCREMSDSESYEMVINEPPFQDNASMVFLKHLGEFKGLRPNVFTHYRDVYSDFVEMLQRGDIDIVVEYRYKDVDAVRAEWKDLEIKHDVVPVAKTHLFVCCKESSPLAKKEALRVEDLADYSILVLYNTFAPMRMAITEMFQERGLEPRFVNITAGSILEYLAAPLSDDSIFILPDGVEYNLRRISRGDNAFIPLEDDEVDLLANFRPDYADIPMLREFHDYLKQTAAAEYGDKA